MQIVFKIENLHLIKIEHILLGQNHSSATLLLSVEHVLTDLLKVHEGLNSLNSHLEGEGLNPLKSGESYILPFNI